MSQDQVIIPNNESLTRFYNIVQNLVSDIQALQEFDTFAATAMSSVLNLMLSRDDEYVKSCNERQKNMLKIPQEVSENVDAIINNVKNKLEQEKSK